MSATGKTSCQCVSGSIRLEQILIKASNGASDFGNKFGQPLITGSVLTFEHEENGEKYAYDKVIMLAGGVGYGKSVTIRRASHRRATRWS